MDYGQNAPSCDPLIKKSKWGLHVSIGTPRMKCFLNGLPFPNYSYRVHSNIVLEATVIKYIQTHLMKEKQPFNPLRFPVTAATVSLLQWLYRNVNYVKKFTQHNSLFAIWFN